MSEALADNALLKTNAAEPAQASHGKAPNVMDLWQEVAAEEAANNPEEGANEAEAADNDNGKAKTGRGEDGKFKKADKVEAKPAEEDKQEKTGKDAPKSETVKALIEERRLLRAKRAEAENKAAELQALLREFESGSQKNVRKLLDDGRLEDAAKALGFDDWNSMNGHVARMLASPEYEHTRVLKEEVEKLKREREEQRQGEERQRQLAAQQAQVAEAMQELHDALSKHSDPTVSGLSEDEDFTRAVYQHMDHVYRTTGAMPDIDDAAEAVVSAAERKFTIWEKHLPKRKGGRPTKEAETRSRVSPDRAGVNQLERKGSKHVSTSTATEASEPVPKNLSKEQWFQIAVQEMRDAARKDAESGDRI